MKRTIASVLPVVAAALSMAACRGGITEQTIRDVEFNVTVGLPGGIVSYAGGALPEGGKSHLGGAYNVDPDNYDLRFIMEAWTDETPGRLAYRHVVTVDDDFLNASARFKARLTAGEYNLVFWADFVPQGSTGDHIYRTSSENGLQEIVISSDGRRAGDESADAYYASKPVDLSLSGPSIGKVVLTRPFGKLRMIATDHVNGMLGDKPSLVKVSFDSAMAVPDTFNALTGEASGSRPAGEYTFSAYREDVSIEGHGPVSDAYVLGTDYILASDAATSYALGVEIYSAPDGSGKIGEKSLSRIPLRKNTLTTVVGNFYSSGGDLEVIVSNDFDASEELVQ